MPEVWTEVQFGVEGVSVSLYREDDGGLPVLVDEYWRTWAEVDDIKGEQHIAVLL